MLKANNEALFQGTNQTIISIRQAELQYYVSVYQSFATQAALIGGFTYGVLQGTSSGSEWIPDLDFFYGLCATLTIIAAVHIILCCLFLQVYGPGLSLYGQTGSMVKATEVLRREQPMIVRSFILMIAFFVCSTVALFWTVMDDLGAIICSVALLIAVRYWWMYSHRIYAQLAWNPTDDHYSRASEDEDPISKMMRAQTAPSLSPLHNQIELSTKTGTSNNNDLVMEGFLTRKIVSTPGSKWDRKYFVLTYHGKLMIFKDRKEYREGGKKSLGKERAIDLEEFQIIFDFPLSSSSSDLVGYPTEVKELLVQSEKKFFFYLASREEDFETEEIRRVPRKYVFTTDTQEELTLWKTAMISFSKD